MSDRHIAKRLTDLERHLGDLEARDVTVPVHREMTVDEQIEVGLNMLAYFYEGDEQVFAKHLVEDYGVPTEEEANRIAGSLAVILEERRAVAENPRYPV